MESNCRPFGTQRNLGKACRYTQATFLRALGRSRSPKAGTGILATVDGIPFFLQSEPLKPFITEDLLTSTTPIFFIGKNGKKMVGYDAELLPSVAEVYLKYRDDCLSQGNPVAIATDAERQKILDSQDVRQVLEWRMP